MSTFKSLVRRGTLLGATGALVLAAIAPTGAVFAQAALNPLTERSLLLSSSAPGYQDTDGSNYSQANPNPAAGPGVPATYALPGTGPNGKKSGQTFTFRTSTTSTIQAFTFQYCTTAAGDCQAPGNNAGDARTPDRVANETPTTGGWANNTSDLNVTAAFDQQGGGTEVPAAGNFQVWIDDGTNAPAAATGTWAMAVTNREDTAFAHPDGAAASRLTGKNNYITLSSATGQSIPAGSRVKIQFTPDDSTFITNPGQGHFFVKINSYSNQGATTIVDGGVTVANVMTDSIHITTKVLETMAFSVGIQNPDTQPTGGGNHGTCTPVSQTVENNRLQLGNAAAEYSLETNRAWDVYSYWRLSSNSSGGATVYYSGNTLANTVGDEIAPITNPAGEVSTPGTEQFGLGFVNAGLRTVSGDPSTGDVFDPAFYNPDYDDQEPIDAGNTPGIVQTNPRYKIPNSFPFVTLGGAAHGQVLGNGNGGLFGFDTLSAAQAVGAEYRNAQGPIHGLDGGGQPNGTPGTAVFKFLPSSSHTPEPIAQQNETVVSCATAKMRYVANIGADTPAGVYTTKVNYLAAPQY